MASLPGGIAEVNQMSLCSVHYIAAHGGPIVSAPEGSDLVFNSSNIELESKHFLFLSLLYSPRKEFFPVKQNKTLTKPEMFRVAWWAMLVTSVFRRQREVGSKSRPASTM